MDNLTHGLVGAALGQAGLKVKSGLAMVTLIIATNLPDIDATCTVYGIANLAMRRGYTHGPLAMVILPALLTGGMLWFDRWQARRGTRPVNRRPVRAGWLFVLALIGTLTHPMLDWLNNYGVRLLEPFSSRWFYGDTLFIIDVWIWVALGLGVWLSRRREKLGLTTWRLPAIVALISVGAYIAVNHWISRQALDAAEQSIDAQSLPRPSLIVPKVMPLAFWQRDILWRDGQVYGRSLFSIFGRRRIIMSREQAMPSGMDDPQISRALQHNAEARSFLFWSRMPIAERQGDSIILRDQRYMDPPLGDRFMVRVPNAKE